ncbi:unnamed protein product [Microthlaspi erraticum]|uniref:Neprosin PEP catalytic domain-containing protein n=1 Tax=Microthlaspi erraticum TaxID=1685480 RepID=A0A6D2I9N7_9BRAS|nr:unnamed protein product [Microthlaspi erraticum]
MAGVGGVVQASHSGSSPPMGISDVTDSGAFANIDVLDPNYKLRSIDNFHVEILLDSTKCYGLRIGEVPIFTTANLGYYFTYGGPGEILVESDICMYNL